MRTKIRRLALLGMLMGGLLGTGVLAPAHAAGTTQIDGSGYYDDATADECDAPPAGFDDYPALVLHGSLEGCLYTDMQWVKDNGEPSGGYIEGGRELVVASLDGGPVGTFQTEYRFQGKYDPAYVPGGVEVHGRCQHPITDGTGTGAFAGASGRLDFKDDVENAVFYYRGHITLG
jgi:hypothetical protein